MTEDDDEMEKVGEFYDGDDQWYDVDDEYIDSIKEKENDEDG